jgi:hypothetical protein
MNNSVFVPNFLSLFLSFNETDEYLFQSPETTEEKAVEISTTEKGTCGLFKVCNRFKFLFSIFMCHFLCFLHFLKVFLMRCLD